MLQKDDMHVRNTLLAQVQGIAAQHPSCETVSVLLCLYLETLLHGLNTYTNAIKCDSKLNMN